MRGVVRTTVGYTGGYGARPTYESVCQGDGHTEAVRVEFDPSVTSYHAMLKVFFRESAGHSGGKRQYKSVIWVHSQEQREEAEAAARDRGKAGKLQILDAQRWHDAESYHQHYYDKGCVLM
uniref:peptide-methionine (S)-S-oxide reductase n=1 Tax=Noctiluca scintillans TaxID=2966 RepID=A0A7S1A2X1_NOCSC|mmetsp:Transcript_29649/g.78568  ORF Transcript_29649/g.78568 Transcript_29649/m.78568 type:complete len:121 (+) Transcript_29649:192-554(+)